MMESSTLKTGQASFAFNLLQKTGLEKSTVISPISISVALGMVLYGAKGNTAKEIQDAISKGVNEVEIHEHFLQLFNYIQENETSIKMANKAYFSKELTMLESYKNGIEKCYHGNFQLMDFTDSQKASDEINAFVSEVTDNEIQKIVSPDMFDEFTRLVLVNAILFEKQWAMKFRLLPNKTLFHSSPNSAKEITMMEKCGDFQYLENEKYKLVKIPYANNANNGPEAHNVGPKSEAQLRAEAEARWIYERNEGLTGDLNMYIILPHERFGLSEIVHNIDVDQLLNDMSFKSLYKKHMQGKITIPLFDVESTFSLKETLQQLNIKDAFEDKIADFTGITANKGLAVSDVLHKAFIKVNETGTKAGAATVAKFYYLSSAGEEEPTFEIFADHPFLYLITDRKDNIYFIGTFFN